MSVRRIQPDIMAREWAAGASFADLAARFGVSEQAIRNYVHRHGLPRRQPAPAVLSAKGTARDDAFLQLWSKNVTQREIACRLHISRLTIQAMVKRLGLASRAKGHGLQSKAIQVDLAAVRAQMAAGKTLRDIAEDIGLSRQRLGSLLANELGPVSDPAPEKPQVRASTAPHPKWPEAADNLIRASAGRYAALAEVANLLGRPIVAVTQRWHQLRAG